MKLFLDITNRDEIFEKLDRLIANTAPVFGKMTPQHMVEHLAFVLEFSYGKNPQILSVPQELAQKSKIYVIYTDKELPKGIHFPGLGEKPPPLKYNNLKEAIEVLRVVLEEFHSNYLQKKVDISVHPVLGELNYQEWIQFHNKHFSHHFKQFQIF